MCMNRWTVNTATLDDCKQKGKEANDARIDYANNQCSVFVDALSETLPSYIIRDPDYNKDLEVPQDKDVRTFCREQCALDGHCSHYQVSLAAKTCTLAGENKYISEMTTAYNKVRDAYPTGMTTLEYEKLAKNAECSPGTHIETLSDCKQAAGHLGLDLPPIIPSTEDQLTHTVHDIDVSRVTTAPRGCSYREKADGVQAQLYWNAEQTSTGGTTDLAPICVTSEWHKARPCHLTMSFPPTLATDLPPG